jgi:REP element-mobilizing transposase RayT
VSHATRDVTKARFPVHVTKRIRAGCARLRNYELCRVLRKAFVQGCRKDGFRICQFSIQGNHIHLVCEAADNEILARGIQGWSVRVARGLNGVLDREGSVFEDRYHFEIIRTPRQMRATLCYVLQNARRHGEWIDRRFNGMDPFSSAWWFDGWNDHGWREGLIAPEMMTVAAAETWLLTTGWRRHGLLSINEVPPAGATGDAQSLTGRSLRHAQLSVRAPCRTTPVTADRIRLAYRDQHDELPSDLCHVPSAGAEHRDDLGIDGHRLGRAAVSPRSRSTAGANGSHQVTVLEFLHEALEAGRMVSVRA